MGPYDKDVAYLRELAERLDTTPDADPDYLRIRFNDLYTAVDRFLRLVASDDPNVPPQLQMEAADKSATDSLRVYELLAVYVPHFIGPEEVRALKYLSTIRARVLHQNEDVTPQAVQVLLDLTDQLGINADQLGVTVAPVAAGVGQYNQSLASALDPEDAPTDDPPLSHGYSAPAPAGQRLRAQPLNTSALKSLSPPLLIGGALVLVVLALGAIFLISRPSSTPGTAGQETRTPVAASSTSAVVVVASATPIVAIEPETAVVEPPTATTAPEPEPPAAARWSALDVLNLRASPSTSADIVRELPAGTIMTSHPDSATQNADGYDWRHVVDDQSNEGWVVNDFIAPAQ